MYFQIENTPEHIRRSRKVETIGEQKPKEEISRLVIAPFSRPPQVVFENVLIGSTCERELEVYNPSKQLQEVTLGKALPEGLVIHLPGKCLTLEPETCYCLTMQWTPMQPTAVRETIRFTNENRGRFDVIVVLKSAMNIKGKSSKKATFKTSPGKMKRKASPRKKSPGAIYKKKAEVIYNTTKIMKTVHEVKTSVQHNFYSQVESTNKENMSRMANDYYFDHKELKCPFDSPNTTNISFDFNSEKLYKMRTDQTEVLQQTYDKCYDSNQLELPVPQNVLKPSSKQNFEHTATDIFENLTFTPLKSAPAKAEKLEKGPYISLTMNCDNDFDDSLDMKYENKENATHTIICITSTQEPTKWLNTDYQEPFLDTHCIETPELQNKKIPNTSSPKEFNSPNFSITTDFSRISDLSFLPQKFSTERKVLARINNDTQEILDDVNAKVSTDTFTKESPNNVLPTGPFSMEQHVHHGYAETRPPQYFQPKVCRQSLFREFQQQRNFQAEHNHAKVPIYVTDDYQNQLRVDTRSPPRSITPPLQSIPEESAQYSQVLDRTDNKMDTFTINRTFDKPSDRISTSNSRRESWSKKAVRAEPELWKVPVSQPKKNIKLKTIKKDDSITRVSISNATFEKNKSVTQNITLNHIGNVYSQSLTVDPFLSSTYYYDEEAVDKFETEFKRWLNYILTPPADLESNIEQKIDVGKAWIENRNKEVPLAPTREQVCSNYHNSHRLASLRRAAKALLMSPEIALVLQKLNAQIEKKLIAIRTDRNLHLDVGLQKIIMEILLSYNPLWLRIGLEAIYGTILPLKSNSDIEGLTTFIIHRMFKNPHLKNKHSKTSAPNMLLPAYMDAIKKFTLKKFFMLVFFLDQAKQKKLIPHDPCLFCRNAICKESRNVIISFTREVIAGIGDITRHLRPLGYVVSHKQSYLDEYKYAVHNIALDIRDGVRLTKVMEIILIKNGLTNQLRTPAISRLQKIHNVQVALNALKEADFAIAGDITANNIADGHREKTLSLLWQLIHVFRAPLFVTAANVIQTWWRKKFQVIKAERMEEERILQQKMEAASLIQHWWRQIQYNRLVELKMQQVTTATVVIQKYYRMWLCRSRLRKLKTSVLKVEVWYRSVKLVREAKMTLQRLRSEREELRCRAAIKIQTYVRRWICIRKYNIMVKRIVLVQSLVRCFLIRKWYVNLRKTVIFLQKKYRRKLLMKEEMRRFAEKRKNAVKVIEERYIALKKMRTEKENFLRLKRGIILAQSLYRGKKANLEYTKQRNALIQLQRRVRANQQMKKDKANFLQTKKATKLLQSHVRAYLAMKNQRKEYTSKRCAAIKIQIYFRSYLLAKAQRKKYLQQKNAAIVMQKHYRSVIMMRRERENYLKLKESAIIIQRRYRALVLMRKSSLEYQKIRAACLTMQRKFRAELLMRKARLEYLKLKSACTAVQNTFRARSKGKKQRQEFLKKKDAAITIQQWYRRCGVTKRVKEEYQQTKQACVTIQRVYRAYIIGKTQRQEYLRIRTATVCIQKYYRLYVEMKAVREQYVQLKTATVKIQKYYRAHVVAKNQREQYMRERNAAIKIQIYYRQYKVTRTTREKYCELRNATIYIQRYYKNYCLMKKGRAEYLKQKRAALNIQQRYKALLAMRKQRLLYQRIRSAALTIQRRYRALLQMRQEKSKYQQIKTSCVSIQKIYRAYLLGRKQRTEYLKLKQASVAIQRRYRALLAMRTEQVTYRKLQQATAIIQRRFRAQKLMLEQRFKYKRMLKATCVIQKRYRAYFLGRKQRTEYLKLKQTSVAIQRRYRALLAMRTEQATYRKLQQATIIIQRRFRAQKIMVEQRFKYKRMLKATRVIQTRYRAYLLGKKQKVEYAKLRNAAITLQRRYRLIRECRFIRVRYLEIRKSVILIQRRVRANKIVRVIRENMAARKIQTWYNSVQKRNECRQIFLKLRKSVILIQSTFRMYRIRTEFIKIKTAIICIKNYYRSYKAAKIGRQNYLHIRSSVINLQAYFRGYKARKSFLRLKLAAISIQQAYRAKKERDLIKKRRQEAAICIQKNIRRYLFQSRYLQYRKHVTVMQEIWRSKLVTRLIRCEFLQNKQLIIRLQAIIRGHLVRKEVKSKIEKLEAAKKQRKLNRAATLIQALFRGHHVRTKMAADRRIAELRRRWREGALHSGQQTLRERNDEAMEVLTVSPDYETVIRAFRSLNDLSEVFPMMYHEIAATIARISFGYMSTTNRSISGVELLKFAASVLVNLARYKVTGPKTYAREYITSVLKYMLRFSNSETELFCILCTYVWLFNKYDHTREDLTYFLNIPENHRMLVTIKANVDRMNRISRRSAKSKLSTSRSFNSTYTPALEPDYGIRRPDKPKYFNDAFQAIDCLIRTFHL